MRLIEEPKPIAIVQKDQKESSATSSFWLAGIQVGAGNFSVFRDLVPSIPKRLRILCSVPKRMAGRQVRDSSLSHQTTGNAVGAPVSQESLAKAHLEATLLQTSCLRFHFLGLSRKQSGTKHASGFVAVLARLDANVCRCQQLAMQVSGKR